MPEGKQTNCTQNRGHNWIKYRLKVTSVENIQHKMKFGKKIENINSGQNSEKKSRKLE